MTDDAPEGVHAAATERLAQHLVAALPGIDVTAASVVLRRKSRDGYWFSPVLTRDLDGCRGDLVVTPRSEAEVVAVLRACHAHGVPCTARGAGTGNYGQAVPLEGGVILDMTALDAVEIVSPGRVRCGAGARMLALDAACRAAVGGELRLFPSTVRSATVGGFVAGGSTGIGGPIWGLLSAPGNVVSARVVTAEREPRVLELKGPDLARVHHAYGTTGIITALEMPLAPAIPWRDMAVAFEDFAAAVRFAQGLCEEPGIRTRLCCLVAAPTPRQYFGRFGAALPEDAHALLLTIAEDDAHAVAALVDAQAGARSCPEAIAELRVPLYEYAWNHTTLQAIKVDRRVTYLQVLFAGADHVADILWSYARFGDETPMHLEFIRLGGAIRCFGLQLLRYSDEARLRAIMAEHEAQGCPVFDPHTPILEDGGMKRVDYTQLAFKAEADPLGLLNPGKMRAWADRDRLLHGAAPSLAGSGDFIG